MDEWDFVSQLCIGDTKNLLLELPMMPWSAWIIDSLYNFLGKTGITPVIAHIDRYFKMQDAHTIDEIFNLGVPVQLECSMLFKFFGRKKAAKLIEDGLVQFIASDCHDCVERPPNLKLATDFLRKKCGDYLVEDMFRFVGDLAFGRKQEEDEE